MPKIPLAFLTEHRETFAESYRRLGFLPTIYSPYYKNITQQMVKNAHSKGVKIITWTVNEKIEVERLKRFGVDGIITDYPDISLI